MSSRLETMQRIGDVVLEINNRTGGVNQVEVMQGLAMVLVGMASKAGQQSIECPVDLLQSEASALIDNLFETFGVTG